MRSGPLVFEIKSWNFAAAEFYVCVGSFSVPRMPRKSGPLVRPIIRYIECNLMNGRRYVDHYYCFARKSNINKARALKVLHRSRKTFFQTIIVEIPNLCN